MILECDKQIADFLKVTINQKENVVCDLPVKKPDKRQNKNGIKAVNLNIISF